MNFVKAVEEMLRGKKVSLPPDPNSITDWYGPECYLEISNGEMLYTSQRCKRVPAHSSTHYYYKREDWLIWPSPQLAKIKELQELKNKSAELVYQQNELDARINKLQKEIV